MLIVIMCPSVWSIRWNNGSWTKWTNPFYWITTRPWHVLRCRNRPLVSHRMKIFFKRKLFHRHWSTQRVFHVVKIICHTIIPCQAIQSSQNNSLPICNRSKMWSLSIRAPAAISTVKRTDSAEALAFVIRRMMGRMIWKTGNYVRDTKHRHIDSRTPNCIETKHPSQVNLFCWSTREAKDSFSIPRMVSCIEQSFSTRAIKQD